MISDELLTALARFFDGGAGPSHDELTRMFGRFQLEGMDPRNGPEGATIGKMKRVREVLSGALDHDPQQGEKLIKALIGGLKAYGMFRLDSPSYAGADKVASAREAFRRAGFELTPDGTLFAQSLENLDGAELTEALWAYVKRARAGSEDAALLVGTGKDLLEATAKHVVVLTTGAEPQTTDLPTVLYLAFDRLGLAAGQNLVPHLDRDPHRALQQALWLLGFAVNRLRNAEGTGHGRPFPASVSNDEARIAVESIGLVSELLLVTKR